MRRAFLAAAVCASLLAAGCGDDSEQEAAPAQPAATETATATEAPAAPADLNAFAAQISKDLKTKPEIPKPAGEPPAELVTIDIVKGKGKTAKQGDLVSMQYVGASWSTGEQFDASWDRGREPFEFELGSGMVIGGWDEGIPGMKVGGRRLLVIPPDLGYGPAGQGPIAPNETLIFVVDLEKVSTP
jgi:FKBP-type peptidyl-prolyl cis-trans isomerase